ncbi:MAG: rhomboid family intramembrane serine protease [Candidatus Bathyarchaeota archaeon]|nr:rhomboid family intramembrane serine protease [Candidatus Bathyarchaeota archaeon]
MFPIYDENKHVNRPYVNYGLLAINIVVFFYFLLQGVRGVVFSIDVFGVTPINILQGRDLWTLVTSMFIHADIIHLFGNMVYLWVFGDNIEDALGHVKYLVFYFLGGFAATFIHIGSVLLTLPSLGMSAGLDIPSVGASGAISAVLGAYLLLYPRARIRTLVFIFYLVTIVAVPAFYYLGFWFLYQLLMGVVSLTGVASGVAFWAHIGGFVAGVVVIKILGGKARPSIVIPPSSYPYRTERSVRPFFVPAQTRKPFVDVINEGDKIRVFAKLPGVEEEDIKVDVSEVDAVISARREELKYYTRVLLPVAVVPQIKDFAYKSGVLSFFLPKKN